MNSEWQTFCNECGLMQPDIQQSDYFMVETNHGTEFIPDDVIGRLPFAIDFAKGGSFNIDGPEFPALVRALSPYVEGTDISEVSPRSGWIARLSAPGYMDCTDWCAFDTEQEAQQYLIDTYGE